jgi:Protein of unknown function (DUF2490)
MKLRLIILLSILITELSFAQDLPLVGIAMNYSQTGRINKKWNYNLHILSVYNTRNLIAADKIYPLGHCHFIPHFLVNRKLNDKFSAGGGVAYGRHNIFGLRENEPRIILQSAYNHKFNRLSFNHRGRLEYRLPINLKTNIRDDALVARYQIGVNFLMYNPKESKKGFYALASDETFFYLKGAANGPVSSKNGLVLSENWSNVGVGHNTGKNRIEVGYGFQSLVRNKKQEMRYFNLFQVNYQISLNWDDMQYWWFY